MSQVRSEDVSAARHLLFVYGTLMRGEHNNKLMGGQFASQFADVACTLPGWKLLSHGGFPGMVQDVEWEGRVTGEVWLVDPAVIPALDRLEGHPSFYRRTIIPVEVAGEDSFERVMVETYVYQKGQGSHSPVMPSGDWRKREER